jgi:uncharacterized protein (TIGR03435 family)
MDDRHPSGAAALSLVAACVIGGTLLARAQTPPGFEATSIRPNTSRNAPPIAMLRGGRFFAPNSTLRELIRVAYLVEDLQIAGGPGWIDADRFSIEATAGDGATADNARLMLRAMLADRFKLATHIEKRNLQGFSLVVNGRGKPEDLRRSGAECAPMRPPAGILAPPPPPPPPDGSSVIPMTAGIALSKCGAMLAGGYLSLRGISIEQLANLLSRLLRRPVVDGTKLTGPYDIDLAFMPETPTPGPVSPDAPSLFTAVQEQLGLKLNPQRVPTDVIVIDRAERPSEN